MAEFDHPDLAPSDAVVALRSFPRRWRGLLATDDDDPEGVAARHPPGGGWSALDHAGHVANALDAASDDLAQTLRADDLAITDPATAPTSSPSGINATLDRLAAAADRLAGVIGGASAEDWTRPAYLPDGRAVNALWLVRAAVQEGARHLRQAEAVIAQVKGRPPTEDDE